jgi:hypothetical protein
MSPYCQVHAIRNCTICLPPLPKKLYRARQLEVGLRLTLTSGEDDAPVRIVSSIEHKPWGELSENGRKQAPHRTVYCVKFEGEDKEYHWFAENEVGWAV